MVDTLEKPSFLRRLEDSCKDLFSGSEFRHFHGFLYENPTGEKPNPENVLSLTGHPLDTPVEVLSLKHFLAPYTSMLPEYGVTEKTQAWKYLRLQNLLEDMLNYVRVYCIEEKGEAIILGETENGAWAGLRYS